MEIVYDTYIVQIARDARLPEADQELEQRGRLMTVSGVASVNRLDKMVTHIPDVEINK